MRNLSSVKIKATKRLINMNFKKNQRHLENQRLQRPIIVAIFIHLSIQEVFIHTLEIK